MNRRESGLLRCVVLQPAFTEGNLQIEEVIPATEEEMS
jgi:hypothetical protein